MRIEAIRSRVEQPLLAVRLLAASALSVGTGTASPSHGLGVKSGCPTYLAPPGYQGAQALVAQVQPAPHDRRDVNRKQDLAEERI